MSIQQRQTRLREIIIDTNSWPDFYSCFHDEDDLRSGAGKDLHPKRANRGVSHDAYDLLKRHVTSLGIGDQLSQSIIEALEWKKVH